MTRNAQGGHDHSVLVRLDGPVAWITLNRPERLNALAGTMRERLAAAIGEASERTGTRVIVITGAGRAFCAGADLDAMRELVAREDEAAFAELVRAGGRVVQRIRSVPQLVVAAVNGVAAGAGASLAIACDLRIASSSAAIGFTFNRIGLHPDWGATHFLPRLVGSGRAAELIFTGRIVGAGEAEQLGLFGRVVPPGDFPAETEGLARELAGKPPLALALAKRSLDGATGRGALEEALRQEAEAQIACFRSPDVREGLSAFREKRPAVFGGA